MVHQSTARSTRDSGKWFGMCESWCHSATERKDAPTRVPSQTIPAMCDGNGDGVTWVTSPLPRNCAAAKLASPLSPTNTVGRKHIPTGAIPS
mmetsp:Transcript_24870/g.45032  ORF Transcript_24870/g.45032 Transcript_24870/m.45032 type:complete len:92 (-) Transcript_24870:272-547(-)